MGANFPAERPCLADSDTVFPGLNPHRTPISMTEQPAIDTLWFTRRDGVVRGPFPAAWIRSYILLGRIRMTDELRLGTGEWQAAFRCEALIPAVLRQPLTEDNLAVLRRARREVDERGPVDRRSQEAATAEQLERRTGGERRRPESSAELRLRARRARELCAAPAAVPASAHSLRGLLILGLLAGLVLLAVLV